MKKILLFLSCILVCYHVKARNDNYVILLDCTRSMNHPSGRYTPVHNDTEREDEPLWNNAKRTVKSLFDQANDGDLINILLFQESVQEFISGVKEGDWLKVGDQLLSWFSIEELYIEKAIEGTKNTCIYTAWNEGERIIKEKSALIDGYNKFFLITDGNEDHGRMDPFRTKAVKHTDELCERIMRFCDEHENTVGYYSNIDFLQEFYNKNNAIYEALRNSKCFHIVFAGRFDTENVVLIQEDIDRGYKDFVINFATIHSESNSRFLESITIDNVTVQSVSSSYFRAEILDSKIHNNQAKLRVFYDSSCGLPELTSDNTHSFDITITSTGKERIFDQHITATAYFELPKLAYLPDEIPQRLTAYYQKPFPIKWIANKMPRIAGEIDSSVIVIPFKNYLPQTISAFYDKEAVKHNPIMTLTISSSNKKKILNYSLLANNSIASDSFVIKGNEDFSLSLDFKPENEVKRYRDKLHLSIIPQRTYGVDLINGQDYKGYSLYIPVEYIIKDAPLTIWIRFLGYVFGVLACWVILVSQFKRPSIKGIIYIYVDHVAIAPIRFKYRPFNMGYKRCVICSSEHKQSNFWGLFVGYKKFVAVPDLNLPIILLAIGRKELLVYNNGDTNNIVHIEHGQTISLGNIRITYTANNY